MRNVSFQSFDRESWRSQTHLSPRHKLLIQAPVRRLALPFCPPVGIGCVFDFMPVVVRRAVVPPDGAAFAEGAFCGVDAGARAVAVDATTASFRIGAMLQLVTRPLLLQLRGDVSLARTPLLCTPLLLCAPRIAAGKAWVTFQQAVRSRAGGQPGRRLRSPGRRLQWS